MTDLPPIPPQLIGEHSRDKDEHIALLKQADEAIDESRADISKAVERLERLQRAIKQYEERAREPGH